MDRRYLMMIADLYGGGPVGIETLAAGLSEPRDTLEDVVEPYLIQLGLIARTARGRCLNGRGWTHLGLTPPSGSADRPVRSGGTNDVCLPPPCSPLPRPPPPLRPRLFASRPTGSACPAATDICSTPLKTTALNPNGYGSTGQSPVARNAGIDCFYVYPTISRDGGVNSDLTPGDGEEKAAVVSQFARFAGTCRTFAPIYRSMTVGLDRRGRRRRRLQQAGRYSPMATSAPPGGNIWPSTTRAGRSS